MANSINATKKGSYNKKTGADTYTKYHFETDTNQVLIDEDLGDIAAGTKLQEALKTIKDTADTGGQGAADLETHKNDKNNPHEVTKAQVGLGSVVNQGMDSEPTSGSEKYVESGGVYTAIENAKATLSQDISDVNNLARKANTSADNAQDRADAAYALASGKSASFVFTSAANLMTGTLLDLSTITGYKVGDNIYLSPANMPDFWISFIAPLGTTPTTGASTESDIINAKDGASVIVKWGNRYITLVATETKTDLSGYYTSETIDSTFAKKDDVYVKTEVDEKVVTLTNGVNDLKENKHDKVLNLFCQVQSSDSTGFRSIINGNPHNGKYEGTFTFRVDVNTEDIKKIQENHNDFSLVIFDQSEKLMLPMLVRYAMASDYSRYRGTAISLYDHKFVAMFNSIDLESSTPTAIITFYSILDNQGVRDFVADRYIHKSQDITLTGDITGKGTYSGIKTELADTGVTAGTYSAVTVDSKGRATAGAQSFVFATSLTDTKLNDLAVGGIAVIDE